MGDCYLSLDVGGSKYIVGLIDRAGEVIRTRKGVWARLDCQCVLETLLAEARALLQEQNVSPLACGITIPGLADPKRGLWVEAQFSGIRDFAICEQVTKALGMPAYCDNDGQAYALAEMIFGACRDARDFLYVNVSNGIGGAVVSGGRLIYGANGNAGEIGHSVVVKGGRPCKCGTRGCLEMYAAGPAIARNYAERGGAPGADGALAQAKEIAARARAGEALAREVFALEGELLAGPIAEAVNLINPDRVIIGGGVSLAFDLFGETLTQSVWQQIYRAANPRLEIVPTPLGYLAGLYGAGAIAVSRVERLFDDSKQLGGETDERNA